LISRDLHNAFGLPGIYGLFGHVSAGDSGYLRCGRIIFLNRAFSERLFELLAVTFGTADLERFFSG
jgi:hypothetical protein